MKKISFISVFIIFYFKAFTAIAAEYSFDFEGSWLEAEPTITKNLASGKILADIRDVHVVQYSNQPEFFPSLTSSDCTAKALLNEDTSPIWLNLSCHISDMSGDTFMLTGSFNPNLGGGQNIIHAGVGKFEGITGNSEWKITGGHFHGGTYAGKINITMPD